MPAPKKPDGKQPAENFAHTGGTPESGGRVVFTRDMPDLMTDRTTGEKFKPSADPESPNWVSPREYDVED